MKKNASTYSYKGYSGSIETDLRDHCLHGRILFVNDLITYEADTLSDLEVEFQYAVDDYLETCSEIGKVPDKPFSGSLNVRIGSTLHRDVALAAANSGKSINDYIKVALEQRVSVAKHSYVFKASIDQIVSRIEYNLVRDKKDSKKIVDSNVYRIYSDKTAVGTH